MHRGQMEVDPADKHVTELIHIFKINVPRDNIKNQ